MLPKPRTNLDKASLRKEMRRRLAALDPNDAKHAARAAARHLLDLPELAGNRRLLVCLSFGVEIDTWQLVGELLEQGHQLFVPRVADDDPMLHVHPYPCPLETLSCGLQQPPAGTEEVPTSRLRSTLDAALVLGLAFDHRGYRLGYGKGNFDRFLAACPVFAIGFAYPCQVVETLPVAAHDLPMSLLVTSDAVWRGGAAQAT